MNGLEGKTSHEVGTTSALGGGSVRWIRTYVEKTPENCFEIFRTAEVGLGLRRFSIAPLQVGQEQRPFLRGPRLPHDRTAVQRLGLAWWLAGRSIRQQVVHGERLGMRGMGVEGLHQRGPFQDDPNSGVAMAVDPPLMTLG